MITIHYDYTDGTELSFREGLVQGDNFATNCLTFFTCDNLADDVIIQDKVGNILSRSRLLSNSNEYTTKMIRPAHNILKIFLAGGFDWQK